jgi:hypothetical protein
MNRALPPGDRGDRNAPSGGPRRYPRPLTRAVGLVCGASDSHDQVSRNARETIEAVGTSGTAPRGCDAIEGRRAPPGRSDRSTDHSITSRSSWLRSHWQREPGGNAGACVREQPGTASPLGRTGGGFQREAAIAVGLGAERKTPPGEIPVARCGRERVGSGFHGIAPLPVPALGGGDGQAHLLAQRPADESAQRLPAGGFEQFLGGSSTRPLEQFEDRGGFAALAGAVSVCSVVMLSPWAVITA